jgi:hypothetical protein
MKNLLKNILAVFLGIMIMLIALEGAARVMSSLLGISTYMKYDALLGWTAKPGAIKIHEKSDDGFKVTYKINSNGFRGTLYNKEKQDNIRRIMILGDSNGFGWGVSENEHFAAILDTKLEDSEIINLSLSGYATDQEYLRFIKEGVKFRPDLVIVQVTENDFEGNQYPFFSGKPKPLYMINENRQLKLHNVPVEYMSKRGQVHFLPVPFKVWLSWNSYAFHYINQKYVLLMRSRIAHNSQHAEFADVERYSARSIKLFNAIISKLDEKLSEINARGIVFHAGEELSKKKYLKKTSLPVLDLYPAFSDRSAQHGVNTLYKDG